MPKWNELIKQLKKSGCCFKRDADGSAEIWENADGVEISLHPHGSKEVKTGMLIKIKKWAGLK